MTLYQGFTQASYGSDYQTQADPNLRFFGEKVGNFRKKLEISGNKLEISGIKLEISGNWLEIFKFLVKNVGSDVKFIGRKILCESLYY